MCARFRPFPTADDPAMLWTPDPESVALWDALVPGVAVTVVKRRIDGSEAARYPATVGECDLPGPWRTLLATWVLPETIQGSLTFTPGDTLHERFSPEHPFDTFGVVSPGGHFKGWYANVTWPAFLERTGEGLELTWQDLYLDLVLTDDAVDILDEDELDASPLPATCPALTDAIRTAIDTMRKLARVNDAPFMVPPTR
ncbi:MAG: DUF402 domain-containing protein [Thermomicrobiales bacterium]